MLTRFSDERTIGAGRISKQTKREKVLIRADDIETEACASSGELSVI
jgi:hypothetical protein